jgi:hypothetical protein
MLVTRLSIIRSSCPSCGLSSLQNIATLQALIPLLNQTGTSTQQQEAATVGVANVLQASMAQLASAAAGLLPQAQQASRDRVNPRGMADDTHLTNPHADGCSFGLSQETNGRGGSLNTVGELVQQMSDKEEDDQAGFNLAREDDNEESEENLPGESSCQALKCSPGSANEHREFEGLQ